MKYRLLLPIVLFLTLLTVGAASAQASTPVKVTDDQVNAVAHELFCPECENIPLDACPSQACIDMRTEIREKLEQSWTKEQIKQYYVERYGDRVLGAPPARGWNWLMYLIPPLAILGSLLIFYRAFGSWKGATSQTAVQPSKSQSLPTIADDYVARLEAELKKAKK